MANMWRSTIQWLGLGSDEEYDDYDPEGEPVPSAGSSRHPRPEPEPPSNSIAARMEAGFAL